LKNGKGKFCSNRCSSKARMNGIYKKCETCNKEFYLNSTELKDGKGRFCYRKIFQQWNLILNVELEMKSEKKRNNGAYLFAVILK
jgi:hypothetical protein